MIDHYTDKGWWGEDTLSSILARIVEQRPDSPALLDPPNRHTLVEGEQKKLSFREVDEAATELAATFHTSGARQGDIVLLQLPNVSEIVLTYLAAAKLGLIVSPVAMQYGTFELTHIAKILKPKFYVTIANFRGQPFGTVNAMAIPICQALFLDTTGTTGAEHIDAYRTYQSNLTNQANDIFTICWTSGTTGRPKGVPRSHNHWMSSTYGTKDAIQLRNDETLLNPFPFINMAAIGGFLYHWLLVGAPLVLHHPFDLDIFLRQLETGKSCLYGGATCHLNGNAWTSRPVEGHIRSFEPARNCVWKRALGPFHGSRIQGPVRHRYCQYFWVE